MEIKNIIIPVRPQPDTIVAIYLLKKFGNQKFPSIKNATITVNPKIGELGHQKNLENGDLLVDSGGGPFDHHNTSESTCAAVLVAKDLNIYQDPSLKKLLNYALRDDQYGMGTKSRDQIDRAFGLSGIIGSLNKQFPLEPEKVFDTIYPLLEAHHKEELVRVKELPLLFEKLTNEKKTTEVILKSGNIKAILIESDNISMPGYLRSLSGGGYNIVIQKRSSGHVNILTKSTPKKRVLLDRLVALVRGAEYFSTTGKNIEKKYPDLIVPAKISEVENWYYDPATNSIQNGGIHTDFTEPTAIPWINFTKMLKIAFDE